MCEKVEDVAVVEMNSTINNNETKNNRYSIYDYFKEHPSLFITTISIFAAVISVLLNLIAFLNANAYLVYFNVDSIFYKQSNLFIYFFAMVLIFLVVIIIFQAFISKTFESYLSHKRMSLLHKYALKEIKKQEKEIKRRHKEVKRYLAKQSKISIDNANLTEDEKVLEKAKENLKKTHEKYTKVRKTTRMTRIACRLLVGISCFITWIMLIVVYALMLSFVTYDWKGNALSALLFSTVYVLVCAIENWFLTCAIRIKRKEIKADAEMDAESKLEKYGNLDEFPISALFSGNIRSIFHNSNFKRTILAVAFCLVVLMFSSVYIGSKSASNQKSFFVVDIDNQTYAMIYNNGENAILEKAEMTDDGIVIDINHQKVISSQNVDMKKYVFEKVDIVRSEHSFSSEITQEAIK